MCVPHPAGYGLRVPGRRLPGTSLTIAAIPLIVYMLLGRNPYMSLGPESTVALMAAAAVATVATAYNVPWTTALAVTTVLVGIVLGIGWLIKASFLADLLSNPPHRLSDRGCRLMIISQLPKILGYDLDTGSIAGLVSSQWHVPELQTVTIAATVVIAFRLPGDLQADPRAADRAGGGNPWANSWTYPRLVR